MVGKARNALAGQGRTGAGGELEQGELGGHSQISQGQLIADQKGATSGQHRQLLQAGLQLLTTVTTNQLAKAGEQLPGQGPNQGAQGPRGCFGQQGAAQQAVVAGGLEQGQANPGGQGRIGPVFEQEDAGTFERIAGEQRHTLAFALQIVGDGG